MRWINESLAGVRASFPDLDYTFSNWENCGIVERDLSMMDILELHIWMAGGPFYKEVGYKYEKFESTGYDNLVKKGAEGIILGCTEIGLLVKRKDNVVPIFDTTNIHAVAAVEFALSE